MASAEHHIGERIEDSVWKHPNLIFGAIGIFVYVGGEVAIGSSIANYLALDNIGAFLSPATIPDAAARYRAAVGGAVIPWLVGKAGDLINHRYYPGMIQGETSWGQGIHYALIAAAFCYLYILFFAVSGSKPNSERYSRI